MSAGAGLGITTYEEQARELAAQAGLHPHAEVGGIPVSWITTRTELEQLREFIRQQQRTH